MVLGPAERRYRTVESSLTCGGAACDSALPRSPPRHWDSVPTIDGHGHGHGRIPWTLESLSVREHFTAAT